MHCDWSKCFIDETCDEGTVKLVGSDDASRGRVEYCYNRTWHSVCADGWDTIGAEEARVVCETMGYDTTRYGKVNSVIIVAMYYVHCSFCPS